MGEYKGSLQETLGITEERTEQLGVIAEDIAGKMDKKEIDSSSALLLYIQKLEALAELEKLLLAFRFGQIV